MSYTPEFESPNTHLENFSRRERMRILAVKAVVSGIVEAQPVTPPEVAQQHGFNINGDYV